MGAGSLMSLGLSWWHQDAVSQVEKAKPTRETEKAFATKQQCTRDPAVDRQCPQVSWPQISRDVGRGKTEAAQSGGPCAHRTRPPVPLAEVHSVSRVSLIPL